MVDGEMREASIGCSTVGGGTRTLVAAMDYQAVRCQYLERRLEVEKTSHPASYSVERIGIRLTLFIITLNF
jgi:hypothetical protein